MRPSHLPLTHCVRPKRTASEESYVVYVINTGNKPIALRVELFSVKKTKIDMQSELSQTYT